MPVVDNHCHLDLSRSPEGWEPSDGVASGEVEAEHHRQVALRLSESASVGVPRVVQIGCDLPSARWTVTALDRHDALLGGVALHPNDAPRLHALGRLESAHEEIEALAAHPRVRVIGETGLDHFRTGPDDHGVQEESFRRHIGLAKELGLALQIHDRDAHDDVLRVLTEEGAPEKTVFHCFSGDAEMARFCAAQGWYLSFAGVLTFKNAAPLRAALREVPLEQVLVETDAPYLTPVPYRGRPNAGYLLPHTVRAVAAVLDHPLDTTCVALASTSEGLYGPW